MCNRRAKPDRVFLARGMKEQGTGSHTAPLPVGLFLIAAGQHGGYVRRLVHVQPLRQPGCVSRLGHLDTRGFQDPATQASEGNWSHTFFDNFLAPPVAAPGDGYKKSWISLILFVAGADLVSTCLVKSVLRAEVSVTSLIRGIIYNCQ